MTGTHDQIDAIVREVVRRLREPQVTAAARSTTSDTVGGPSCDRSGEMVLAGRVITRAALDNPLKNGVRRIVISPGAVITPSARDELKSRGIQLAYAPKADRTTSQVLLATWKTQYDPTALLQSLRADSYDLTAIDDSEGLERVGKSLTDPMAGPSRVAVVLTDRPSLALCLVNHPPAIRAAWGVDLGGVADAVKWIAPNLLVLEPPRHGLAAMASMIRALVRQAGSPCPAALEKPPRGET